MQMQQPAAAVAGQASGARWSTNYRDSYKPVQSVPPMGPAAVYEDEPAAKEIDIDEGDVEEFPVRDKI